MRTKRGRAMARARSQAADGASVGVFVKGGGERAYELGRARLGRGGIGWRGRRGRRGGGRVGLLVGSEMVRRLSVWVWLSKGVGIRGWGWVFDTPKYAAESRMRPM